MIIKSKSAPKLMFSALTQKIYIVINGRDKFDVTEEAIFFVENRGKIKIISK